MRFALNDELEFFRATTNRFIRDEMPITATRGARARRAWVRPRRLESRRRARLDVAARAGVARWWESLRQSGGRPRDRGRGDGTDGRAGTVGAGERRRRRAHPFRAARAGRSGGAGADVGRDDRRLGVGRGCRRVGGRRHRRRGAGGRRRRLRAVRSQAVRRGRSRRRRRAGERPSRRPDPRRCSWPRTRRDSPWCPVGASTWFADSPISGSSRFGSRGAPSSARSVGRPTTSSDSAGSRSRCRWPRPSEAVDRMYDATIEYLQDRWSFGRPLASYQALKHRLADMLLMLETGEGLCRGGRGRGGHRRARTRRGTSASRRRTSVGCRSRS